MKSSDRETVIRLRSQGVPYSNISKETGISINTIKSYCRRHDIYPSHRMQDTYNLRPDITHCEYCGELLQQDGKRKQKRFCSDRCRNKWWQKHPELINRKAVYEYQCLHCNKVFYAYGNASRKYCSHECYIEKRFGGGNDD